MKISKEQLAKTIEEIKSLNLSEDELSITLKQEASEKKVELKVWCNIYNSGDAAYFSVSFLFLKNKKVEIYFHSAFRANSFSSKEKMLPFVNYNLRRHGLSGGFNNVQDLIDMDNQLLNTKTWEEGIDLIKPIAIEKEKRKYR